MRIELFGGYSIFLENGHLEFDKNDLGVLSHLRAERSVSKGLTELSFEFDLTDKTGGSGTLYYGDEAVARGRIKSLSTTLTLYSDFSIGRDSGALASDRYTEDNGFPFSRDLIQKIVVELK